VTESVKVTLSLEGLKAAASSKSSDVIASNAQAKRVEKIREQIKELQEKIREQQAELQSIQTSKGLSADQKVQRISAVSQQLAGLNSALAGMSAQLMEALKGQNQAAGGEGVQPLPFVRHDATPSTNA
jgi:TolA-binding protein